MKKGTVLFALVLRNVGNWVKLLLFYHSERFKVLIPLFSETHPDLKTAANMALEVGAWNTLFKLNRVNYIETANVVDPCPELEEYIYFYNLALFEEKRYEGFISTPINHMTTNLVYSTNWRYLYDSYDNLPSIPTESSVYRVLEQYLQSQEIFNELNPVYLSPDVVEAHQVVPPWDSLEITEEQYQEILNSGRPMWTWSFYFQKYGITDYHIRCLKEGTVPIHNTKPTVTFGPESPPDEMFGNFPGRVLQYGPNDLPVYVPVDYQLDVSHTVSVWNKNDWFENRYVVLTREFKSNEQYLTQMPLVGYFVRYGQTVAGIRAMMPIKPYAGFGRSDAYKSPVSVDTVMAYIKGEQSKESQDARDNLHLTYVFYMYRWEVLE